jgi:outer membrane protein
MNRIHRPVMLGIMAMASSFSLFLHSQESNSQTELRVNLSQCIQLALKSSRAMRAQGHSIRAAETRLKQARSGRYPSLGFAAAYLVSDEDVNSILPASTIQTSGIDLGFLILPPLSVDIPQQVIKMADRQTGLVELDLAWPLYTGGKISALIEQAEAGIALARSESRTEEAQVVYNTKKIYYSVILASNLEKTARTACDRLLATLKVSETLYQEGSGKITKSDYLKIKIFHDSFRSLLYKISGGRENASTALAEMMGLDWPAKAAPADEEIPFQPKEESMDSLLLRLTRKNPQIEMVGHALELYRARMADAKSERYPALALIGGYRRMITPYDYGMTTRENKNTWTVGIGMKVSLFDGFRTGGMVEESRALLDRLAQQREMLERGLSLKSRVLCQKIKASTQQVESMRASQEAAIENSRLVERAYFSEIMELKDLMQVQITEAVIKAQYQMARFEYADLRAQLDMLLANQPESSGK